MHSCLFVCTANICRSPIAQALFQQQVQNRRDASIEWQIASGGTWAVEGQPAAPNTIQVLMEKGIDLSNHRSRMIDRRWIDPVNLILVMETNQKEALQFEFPQQKHKIFLLSEMIDKNFEIADLNSQPIEEFRRITQWIESILTDGYPKILHYSSGDPV